MSTPAFRFVNGVRHDAARRSTVHNSMGVMAVPHKLSNLEVSNAWGRTEVVSLLVKAGAALDLPDRVNMWYSSHHSVMLCVIQT